MRKSIGFVTVMLLVMTAWQPCLAEVDLDLLNSIPLEAEPLDVAESEDGRRIYVLTGDAHVRIYSNSGALQGAVAVPEGSRRITTSRQEDVLLVTNPAKRTLEVVRINLQYDFSVEGSPSKGPADAPVTLTLFTDFECSYCAQLASLLDQVHQQYPDNLRIVFKHFPLRMHRFAAQASLAAMAAHDQGQFWPFHDRLFQNYNNLNAQKVEEIRQELGLDAEQFQARMNDPALKDLIRRDLEEGNAAGVRGTPTVFINRKKFRGPRSLEGFGEVIESISKEAE